MKNRANPKLRSLRLFVLIFASLFCCHAHYGLAQSGMKITGRVTDAMQQPIAGASVVVKGTTSGVSTDQNGNYGIVIPDGKAVLAFSFLGYRAQELVVGNRRVVDVTLQDDSRTLQEVVVVAYGTQTKASLTGALSSVDTKELVKAPVASVSNVLAGALPGVSTIQTTGQPGRDAATIYVRGTGSLSNASSRPLVLVDGVERDFSQIDPNEIESLSVLKDASATAVFGVRGANGVVLVTTRRGKSGKPSISVSTLTGVQQPMSYVRQTGSYEFARFWNLKQRNDHIADQAQYFSREAIEAYRTGSDPIMYPNVDWGGYMYNKFFLQTKNNINISGGNDAVKYFVSFGYLYQNGILKQFHALPYDNNYSYNRYNYRANLDMKLTGTTTMRLNIGGNVGQPREPRPIEDIDNPWVYNQIWTLPFAGPGLIDGVRTLVPNSTYMTPVGFLRDGLSTFWGTGYREKYQTTLNTDVEITQKLDMLTPGLSVSVKGSYDNYFELQKVRNGGGVESRTAYYKSFLQDQTKPQTDPDYDKTIVYVPTGNITPLTYAENYGRDRNWYLEGRINYNRTFGDHKVSGLFLYNQSRNYYPTNSSGSPASYIYIPRSYVGFVGRVTYAYKSKYLVDVNAGYNGSENFAPGKGRYGLFPAASVGWVISEERFLKGWKMVDYLKLRASFGRVGSDTGTDTRFMYMPGVWTGGGSYSFGVTNPNGSPAFGMGTPGNDKVSWETADKQNYGLDLKAFGSRLSLSADYFYEHRTGILIAPRSIPSIIATSLPNLNLGVVDNHGYELSLGWDEARRGGLHYYVNANVSFARNKILAMDEVPNKYAYMNQTGGSTGRQTEVYKYIRLYQAGDFTPDGKLNSSLPQPSVQVFPGDAMYADLNGDGVVDGDDRMTTGYAERPEYTFGLNAGLDYKGFSFSMQWSGATHVNKMLEIEYRIPFTNAGKRGLLQYFYDNCWTEEHQRGATLPRAAETSEAWNSQSSTLWLRDASYFRLKTVSIGYTFTNRRFLRAIGAGSLGISLSGYNLLTFSPLKIIDPESLGNNLGAYPLVKIYSLGININF